MAGLSLLGSPADEVVERLAARYAMRVEDSGQFVVLDDLLVALWRPYVPDGPHDMEGKYFESILVALPGYYDDKDQFAGVLDAPGGNAGAGRVDPGSEDSLF